MPVGDLVHSGHEWPSSWVVSRGANNQWPTHQQSHSIQARYKEDSFSRTEDAG